MKYLVILSLGLVGCQQAKQAEPPKSCMVTQFGDDISAGGMTVTINGVEYLPLLIRKDDTNWHKVGGSK